MTIYKKFKLDESVNAFLLEVLSSGSYLHRQLIEQQKISEGTAYAFLPNCMSTADAHNFKHGIYTDYRDKLDEMKMGDDRANTYHPAIALIDKSLKLKPNNVLLVYDMASDLDDADSNELGVNVLTHDKEVYFGVASQESTLKLVHSVLYSPVISQFTVGVVSSLPGLFENRKMITDDELRDLAQSTFLMVFEAYDGEGYIVWEKDEKR